MLHKVYNNYKELIINTVIATFLGIIIGFIDAVFGKVLLRISDLRDSNVLMLVPFLPLSGILIIRLYKRFSEESIKGMTLVFETGIGNSEKIPKTLLPLVILCTWITHLFGGSAGREGVAVQLGAVVAHTAGRRLKLQNNSRILLVAGMAAGFSGLFQTPLAATFFAMEVLVAGTLMYDALLPALSASFVASFTSHLLGLEKFTITVQEKMEMSPFIILKLIIIGIAFGLVGGAFAYLLGYSKQFFIKIFNNPIKRIFFMGCGLAVILLLLHLGRYSGLGTNLINASFSGNKVYSYDWIIKIALTILTLSAGFQGGEVTPLFSIGATLGIVLAHILGIPPMITASLGYAAVFGSATNTLLAPIFIGFEVFGSDNILYFVVVCSIAYMFNGNKTIYGSQKRYSYLDTLQDKDT